MTEEEFNKLLKWLDEDREQSGLRYTQLRRRLEVYFINHNCADAEELADNVLDAIARHLHKRNSLLSGNPYPYIFGIARNVQRRYFNGQTSKQNDIDWDRLAGEILDDDAQFKEVSDRCLERCLRQLKDKDCQLFLMYYLKMADRLKLAAQFKMTINALRLKMMRLREQLRLCIESCQKNAGA